MSINFRPAISNLFFNTSNAFEPPKSRLLELGIQRLDPIIPLLVNCVTSAPSNAVAIFTMNLVEVTFRQSHKPLVLALADACLKEGIEDREFWIGTNIGARICSYFDKLLGDLVNREQIEVLAQELDHIIGRLILIGVPEAQRLQETINLDD